MYEQLKQFNTDKQVGIDEMVGLLAFGTVMQGAYQKLQIEIPDWVTNTVQAIEREINDRRRDHLEKQLKDDELALEGLQTAAERRAKIQERMARTKAQLGR